MNSYVHLLLEVNSSIVRIGNIHISNGYQSFCFHFTTYFRLKDTNLFTKLDLSLETSSHSLKDKLSPIQNPKSLSLCYKPLVLMQITT